MYSSLDTVWVLLCTALIFFMQAGFAMLETGFTRAKNAGNIIMKNLMDYCIGSVLFWGYRLQLFVWRLHRRIYRNAKPVRSRKVCSRRRSA